MEKKYWWRNVVVLLSAFLVILGWVYDTYFCFSNNDQCLLDAYRLILFEPLFILSLSLLIVSPFLFFITDSIFLKWLKFTLGWFFLSIIFIILAPVSSGGFIGLNPEKESVSIWMASLFVIISLILIRWNMRKK